MVCGLVNYVELLGKNIPCKSSILLYFHRLGESCYFIIEIRILHLHVLLQSWAQKKSLGLAGLYLRIPKIFKQPKFIMIKFLCSRYSSAVISLRSLRVVLYFLFLLVKE